MKINLERFCPSWQKFFFLLLNLKKFNFNRNLFLSFLNFLVILIKSSFHQLLD
jgi:hypothetical protein